MALLTLTKVIPEYASVSQSSLFQMHLTLKFYMDLQIKLEGEEGKEEFGSERPVVHHSGMPPCVRDWKGCGCYI